MLFLYDSSGRLTQTATLDSGVLTGRYAENDITYNRNGNILTLKRYGANALKKSISETHFQNSPTIFKGKIPESCSQFKLQDEMAVEDCEFGCD